MAKISVVLPVYNGERYLQQALESIINQTFSDWELIIVDDCSTDSSASIMRRFAEKDSRIVIVTNETNKKLPASLNAGFGVAGGEYLTWTSDDNMFTPTALENMYKYLEDHEEIMMVTADMEIMNDLEERTDEFVANPNSLPIENEIGACFLYRRQVLETIGTYDEQLFLVEDYDYWLRIFEKYGKIGHISKILYKYRNHEGSLTNNYFEQVNKRVNIIREKHRDSFIKWIRGKEEWSVRAYAEFLEFGGDNKTTIEMIKRVLPDSYCGMDCIDNSSFVIYGAGQYGRKALEILAGKVWAFFDMDSSKIGKKIGGLTIFDASTIANYKNEFDVVIAVNSEKIMEVIRYLQSVNIDRYIIIQQLIYNRKMKSRGV